MKFIRSFSYAWQGIRYCFQTQQNFRIQLTLCLAVIITGFALKISNTEWLFIIICSMMVLVLELLNTAIEHLCNTITTDIHPAIKIIKDASAAAVLLAATGSAVAGFIIFFLRSLTNYRHNHDEIIRLSKITRITHRFYTCHDYFQNNIFRQRALYFSFMEFIFSIHPLPTKCVSLRNNNS